MVLDLSAFYSNADADGEIEVHIDMEAAESKLGVFPILKKEPFSLHLTNVENRYLLIQGALDVTISIPCDRCLEEVPVELHLVIDKKLPIDSEPGTLSEEQQSSDSEKNDDNLEQLEYMNGCQLDADRLVYGEILFAWPAKVLCREDCKGICNRCGTNLNRGSCSCERSLPDPRMSVIQDIFQQFKEV